MIALIQRVSSASVDVRGQTVGAIELGILAFIGVEASDSEAVSRQLVEKILSYRIFPDNTGKMNLDLRQIGGGLLLTPQFTLVADTRKGNRPSFSDGATPEQARELFQAALRAAEASHSPVASGVFGADMQVQLVNDGPVTFLLKAT
jgi:D-tyrosyl-tRNA(Tyr) deacylase